MSSDRDADILTLNKKLKQQVYEFIILSVASVGLQQAELSSRLLLQSEQGAARWC